MSKAGFDLEENSGSQFASIVDAQALALEPLRLELAGMLRDLLDEGILTIEDGEIKVNGRLHEAA
jgi:hypothetical protein